MRDISAILKRFDDDLRAASLSNGQASRHWEKRCNEIKRDADSQSVFDFARWPSLSEISVTAEAVPQQWLEEMEADPAWNWRWYQLTRDNYIGNPKPYGDMRWTSPVLIEHTYNLFQYEKRTGQSLLDCDVYSDSLRTRKKLLAKVHERDLTGPDDSPRVSERS